MKKKDRRGYSQEYKQEAVELARKLGVAQHPGSWIFC